MVEHGPWKPKIRLLILYLAFEIYRFHPTIFCSTFTPLSPLCCSQGDDAQSCTVESAGAADGRSSSVLATALAVGALGRGQRERSASEEVLTAILKQISRNHFDTKW